ncbi:MAG: hypothetical protein PVS3B3_30420 [Ktedonobacteraceae bacterium]
MLAENLVGFYLHGSLALGGFNPARSDVNIVAVTRQRMSTEVKRTLVTLLLRISKMPCPVSIHFLAQHDTFPFQHPLPYDLYYNESMREHAQQEVHYASWQHWNDSIAHDPDLTIILTVLQLHGICLYGEPPAKTLPVVPEQAFRDALVTKVQTAQRSPLHDPISFVLNACRVAAYLHDHTVLSKDAGGVWALASLPEQYHPLIQQLLALYRSERPGRPVGHAALQDFATYIHATIIV